MNPQEYMQKSALTLAEQDEGQRTFTKSDLLDIALLLESSNDADFLKRKIFYKDANAIERFRENAEDIEQIFDSIEMLDDDYTITINQDQMDMLHASIGLVSESGELLQATIGYILNGEFDSVNAIEEVGDTLWYSAIPLRNTNHAFEDAFEANINKLMKKRYKNGFTTEDAVNRDLDAERDGLEKDLTVGIQS